MSKQCVIVTSFVPVKICIFKKKRKIFLLPNISLSCELALID